MNPPEGSTHLAARVTVPGSTRRVNIAEATRTESYDPPCIEERADISNPLIGNGSGIIS